MNIDYDRYNHFFEHRLNFNQTWTSYTEYLYNQLKYYEVLRNNPLSSVEAEFYIYLETQLPPYQDLDNITHHRYFHDYVMDLCNRYKQIFDAKTMLPDTYENHSLYFMCHYYINNPPFPETPQILNREKITYPLSFQFNRKACNHIMVSIYEFIERVPLDEQQGLYYQITNDFMDLFDKIQEDCDSMGQLRINNLLTNGCLTPHPECNSPNQLFFSPGIPMEYIKYLMVQKLNDGVDINGYSWLKKRIDKAPLVNPNSMRLADRIIPFDEEYTNIILRYQRGRNTMERTISSLLNFKLQVISGNNSLKMHHDISPEEFITGRRKDIRYYEGIEEAQSMGAFKYLESQVTSSVKISGEDGAVSSTPPRGQTETQTTPNTDKKKAGKVTKEVLFDDKKVAANDAGYMEVDDYILSPISEEGSSPLLDDSNAIKSLRHPRERPKRPVNFPPDLKRTPSMHSNVSGSTLGYPGSESQNLSGMGFSLPEDDEENVESPSDLKVVDDDEGYASSGDSVMSVESHSSVVGGRKRKKKTRKRVYFKDLLDDVQSGGLIPRRIYFNDLL